MLFINYILSKKMKWNRVRGFSYFFKIRVTFNFSFDHQQNLCFGCSGLGNFCAVESSLLSLRKIIHESSDLSKRVSDVFDLNSDVAFRMCLLISDET